MLVANLPCLPASFPRDTPDFTRWFARGISTRDDVSAN